MEHLIVGIDPSLTSTGVAQLWVETGETRIDSVKSKPSGAEVRERVWRYHRLVESIMELVGSAGVPPDRTVCVYLESHAYSRQTSGVIHRAEFGGILRHQALLAGWEITEVTPQQIKKFATGKGVADKLRVALALANRYGVVLDSDDEYDAYGLLKIGCCVEGIEKPQTNFQQVVVDTIRGQE